MASPHRVNVTSKRRRKRRIVVINQKGGSTKTTTAVNLAAALVKLGYRVRLHDVDPQKGSATFWLPPRNDVGAGLYDVFNRRRSLDEATAFTSVENLFIVPSWRDMRELDAKPVPGTEVRLRNALDTSEADVDFEILDCPHDMSALAIAGLAAGEEVIIPVQASGLDTSGFEELVEMFDAVKDAYVPTLEISGIVIGRTKGTNYDRRLLAKYREEYPKAVVLGIADSVRMREASEQHLTIDQYEPSGTTARDFATLAKKIEAWELAA